MRIFASVVWDVARGATALSRAEAALRDDGPEAALLDGEAGSYTPPPPV